MAADAIRLTRRFVAQPAFARLSPAGVHARRCDLRSDAELAQAAGDIGTTIFHPVGTALMGRDDDPKPSSTRG